MLSLRALATTLEPTHVPPRQWSSFGHRHRRRRPAREHRCRGAIRMPTSCPADDSGLRLPAGFCATIFADGIGHARHLVVAPNGVVYVNTWSGRYYGNDTPACRRLPGRAARHHRRGKGRRESSASARPCRAAARAAPASACTRARLCRDQRQDRALYAPRRARSCRAGPAVTDRDRTAARAAIIPCIRSRSTPTGPCTSTSPPRPTPASRRIASPKSPGHQSVHGARDARRHLAL